MQDAGHARTDATETNEEDAVICECSLGGEGEWGMVGFQDEEEEWEWEDVGGGGVEREFGSFWFSETDASSECLNSVVSMRDGVEVQRKASWRASITVPPSTELLLAEDEE
ncbi:hypothetical protein HDU67_003751, partial [Dinochytrium kinnereticum]